MSGDPLTEAIAALRVLGNESTAFGSGARRGREMARFARAARERVVQLRDESVTSAYCSTCGEYPAGPSGRCRRCEASLREERETAPHD